MTFDEQDFEVLKKAWLADRMGRHLCGADDLHVDAVERLSKARLIDWFGDHRHDCYAITVKGKEMLRGWRAEYAQRDRRIEERNRLVELMMTGAALALASLPRPAALIVRDAHELAEALIAFREREKDPTQ